jgi:threonine dehydrogenase-like Zn-dependent dehydrogenase
VDLACFGGRVVYVGYSKAPVTYQTQFFNLKELDIMGSRNAMTGDFEAVVAHLEKIGDEADLLISKVFPFAEAEQALPYWDGDRNVLKIIIER